MKAASRWGQDGLLHGAITLGSLTPPAGLLKNLSTSYSWSFCSLLAPVLTPLWLFLTQSFSLCSWEHSPLWVCLFTGSPHQVSACCLLVWKSTGLCQMRIWHRFIINKGIFVILDKGRLNLHVVDQSHESHVSHVCSSNRNEYVCVFNRAANVNVLTRIYPSSRN